MECPNCMHSITPGTELSVARGDEQDPFTHCPYCLAMLPAAGEPRAAEAGSVSVARHELRWQARARFVDDLLTQGHDGQLHCPVCDHRLNKSDELILRHSGHFKCHFCCHDLATVAYRQDAYHERRWLPIVAALGDLRTSEKCARCSYFGAVARGCQLALSWLPGAPSTATALVAGILRRSDWTVQDCEWTHCLAVRRYLELAGDALLLF